MTESLWDYLYDRSLFHSPLSITPLIMWFLLEIYSYRESGKVGIVFARIG
jgi:hypothetical protein